MDDPLRRVHDALEAADCSPQGPVHSFRARCPGHEGQDRNLQVREGSDGRALLCCYVGCATGDVVRALGLKWGDLFPDGHHQAQPLKPSKLRRRVCAGAELLDSFALAGHDWRVMLPVDRCPFCDASRAILWVHARGGLDVECPDGCNSLEVRRAVVTRAAIAERGVTL